MQNKFNTFEYKFEFKPIFLKTLQKIEDIQTQFGNSVLFRVLLAKQAGHQNSEQDLKQLISLQIERCFEEFQQNVLFLKDLEIQKQLKKLQLTESSETVNSQLQRLLQQNEPISDPKHSEVFCQPFPIGSLPKNQSSFLAKVNSKYLVHSIKRMLKSVRIHIEDYQSVIGFFNMNSQFINATQKDVEQMIQSLIIDIEVPCEMWLKRWDSKFAHLLDQIYKQASSYNQNILLALLKHTHKQQIDLPQLDQDKFSQFVYRILNYKLNTQSNGTLLDLFPEYNKFNASQVLTDLKDINSLSSSQKTSFQQIDIAYYKFIMYLCLLQTGNTVDGIVISSKLIKRIQTQQIQLKEPPKNKSPIREGQTASEVQGGSVLQNQPNQQADSYKNQGNVTSTKQDLFASSFDTFNDWRNRRCHGCLEFIMEASRAICCMNLIRPNNVCRRLYCYNCIVAYYTYRTGKKARKEHHYEYVNLEYSPRSKQQKTKKSEPYWHRVCQNILFVCPCCLEECQFLSHANVQSIRHEQSGQVFYISGEKNLSSFCKVFNLINKHPINFINKHIILYLNKNMCNQSENLQRCNQLLKKFILAQVLDYVPQTQAFKICILNKEQALKAIQNTNQQVDINESESTIIWIFQLNQLLFFMLSQVLEYNKQLLKDLGIMTPKPTYHEANELIKQNIKNNHQFEYQSRVFKMLVHSILTYGQPSPSSGDQPTAKSFCTLDIRSNIIEKIDRYKIYDNEEWKLIEKYANHLDRRDVLNQIQIGDIIKDSVFILHKERTSLVDTARIIAEEKYIVNNSQKHIAQGNTDHGPAAIIKQQRHSQATQGAHRLPEQLSQTVLVKKYTDQVQDASKPLNQIPIKQEVIQSSNQYQQQVDALNNSVNFQQQQSIGDQRLYQLKQQPNHSFNNQNLSNQSK